MTTVSEDSGNKNLGSASEYVDRGRAHNRNGDIDKALTDFNEAIRLDPNYEKAYYYRGNMYSRKGDTDKAVTDFTEAIRIEPDYTGAYYGRGNAYSQCGKYDLAIADFSTAIQHNPNDIDAYYCRGVVYKKRGDFDNAIADFTEIIRLNPDYSFAYDSRGEVYSKLGRVQEAIRDYEKFLELDPNGEEVVSVRDALIKLKMERDEIAKKIAQKEKFWIPFGLLFGAISGGGWFATLDFTIASSSNYGGYWCIIGIHTLLLGLLFLIPAWVGAGRRVGCTMGCVGLIGVIPIALFGLLVGVIPFIASIIIGILLGAFMGFGMGTEISKRSI